VRKNGPFDLGAARPPIYTCCPKAASILPGVAADPCEGSRLGGIRVVQLQPVILTGRLIQLVPLAERHIPDLAQAGEDPAIWRYFNMPVGWTTTEANMAHFVRELLNRRARGTELPFAVSLRETGRAIGMVRYADIDARHRHLEVGGTWYGTPYQ